MKISVKFRESEIVLEENSIDKDKYASIRFNSKEIIDILKHLTEECAKIYNLTK